MWNKTKQKHTKQKLKKICLYNFFRWLTCLLSAKLSPDQVYHNFHDEVEEYRRHWWRCDGPCQFKEPYYGYVKRSTNRAPSAHDYWWATHQKTCGGTYVKVKEPENYSKKGREKTKPTKQPAAAAAAASEKKGDPRPRLPSTLSSVLERSGIRRSAGRVPSAGAHAWPSENNPSVRKMVAEKQALLYVDGSKSRIVPTDVGG